MYSIEIKHGNEPDPLEYGQYNDRWIDEHAILPRRSINDYLNLSPDNKKIVISAPTGSGKSLRLSQAIAYDKSGKNGIIAVHCKAAGKDLYDKIIALNPKLKDEIKLLFYGEPGYEEYINDPNEIGNYIWTIMYKDRLYYGDVDQMLLCNIRAAPIIISDETIIGSDKYNISDIVIDNIDNLIIERSSNIRSLINNEDDLNVFILWLRDDVVFYYKKLAFMNDAQKSVELNRINYPKFMTYFLYHLYNNINDTKIDPSKFRFHDCLSVVLIVRDIIYVIRKCPNIYEDRLKGIHTITRNKLITSNVPILVFDASGNISYKGSTFDIYDPSIRIPSLVRFNILDYKMGDNYSPEDEYNKDNKLLTDSGSLSSILPNSIVCTNMSYRGLGTADSPVKFLEDNIPNRVSNNIEVMFYHGSKLVGSNTLRDRDKIYFMNIPRVNTELLYEYELVAKDSTGLMYDNKYVNNSNNTTEVRQNRAKNKHLFEDSKDEGQVTYTSIGSSVLLQAIGRTKYRSMIKKYYDLGVGLNNVIYCIKDSIEDLTNTDPDINKIYIDPNDITDVYFTSDFIQKDQKYQRVLDNLINILHPVSVINTNYINYRITKLSHSIDKRELTNIEDFINRYPMDKVYDRDGEEIRSFGSERFKSEYRKISKFINNLELLGYTFTGSYTKRR